MLFLRVSMDENMKFGCFFLLCCLQFSCSNKIQDKIDGISLVASRELVTQEQLCLCYAIWIY